jgi:UDP-N-acetylglucosamine--N-acetylmuramyl-(pentapeptide) pyrophosphoryl-undecaprenol N-acetylglucosamine transferase
MNLKNSKLCITTGGTGGHVLPAVSFAQYLMDHGNIGEISFCVDYRGVKLINKSILQQEKFHLHVVNSWGNSYFKRIVKILFFSIKSLFFMKNFDALICFGTYNSVPFLISAILFRKKIILHEQNCTLSRLNKLFLSFATYLNLSFPVKNNIGNTSKEIFTGIPLREDFYREMKKPSEYEDKFTILIVFGSLGGGSLNEFLREIINLIPKKYWEKIRFLASKDNLTNGIDIPSSIEIENFPKDFNIEIAPIYNNCHMSICRGGAVFLYEMLILQKKMLIFPLKNSVGDHQKYNAEYIQSMKKGRVIYDPDTQKKEIVQYISQEMKEFLKNPKKYNSKKTPIVPLESAEKIANCLIKV